MKHLTYYLMLFAWIILAMSSCQSKKRVNTSILPKPVVVNQQEGSFVLNSSILIKSNKWSPRIKEIASLAQKVVKERVGLDLSLDTTESKLKFSQSLLLEQVNVEGLGTEGYNLFITKDLIHIQASQPQGLLYGIQTLRQMLPIQKMKEVKLPCLTIKDYPRFSWRGLHLDVGRHFFDVKEVKRFIDLMSMYKLNIFHWHLTEDQGWRIEIKKYPKLTQIGAFRKKIGFKRNQERGLNKERNQSYGGYYTQEEVKEVVEYARLRGVTIVPEIEMPGHSSAALASYPEFYCFPKEKLEVLTEGGVSNGVYCAGKEETFQFLTDVLDEVLALFPSKMIHIGGDEAPKQNWRRCSLCQRRMQKEGLKNEHELQSYFIKRIENYLISKGRKLVGWDEIMQGGLSDGATVMSWRGITPGLEAAQQRHDVIMTPGSVTYISRPQSVNSVTQCKGEVLTMRDVYAFNPIPKELKSKEQKHIIGVQACQWTEGTPTIDVLEYKEYPRAIALAEVAWTPQSQRKWTDFYSRLSKHLNQLNFYGVKYGQRSYDVRINVVPDTLNNKVYAQFVTEVPTSIYYTVDGTKPTRESQVVKKHLLITKDCVIKASTFRPDGSQGRVMTQKIIFHKALGKKVTYKIPYSTKHDGGGEYAMTNGMLGKWQGFEKRNVDIILDLGKETTLNEIVTHWKYDISDWVFRPLMVSYALSKDGRDFHEVYHVSFKNKKGVYDKGILNVFKQFEEGLKTRYIRVRAKNQMINPAWHGSAGGASWIFIDELLVK